MTKPSPYAVKLIENFLASQAASPVKSAAGYTSVYGFLHQKGKWGETVAFLNPLQLSEALGVSIKTLERWRKSGNGPAYVTVGKQIRYPIVELDRWVVASLKE